MDINRMKLGLVHIFSENNKISNKTKLQLINFIEKANLRQLKVLAMDGQLVPKTVFDEEAKQFVDDRFNTMPQIMESLKKASTVGLQSIVKRIK